MEEFNKETANKKVSVSREHLRTLKIVIGKVLAGQRTIFLIKTQHLKNLILWQKL